MSLTLALLRPSLYLASALELKAAVLADRGIKGLILDLDNTLLPWGREEIPAGLPVWLAELRRAGITACVVSNNKRRRVEHLSTTLGVPWVHGAGKPRGKGFRAAMAIMGTDPSNTAVMGDQIFTDVFGGNRLGLFTVLVTPVSSREFVGTRLVRLAEWLVLRGLGI